MLVHLSPKHYTETYCGIDQKGYNTYMDPTAFLKSSGRRCHRCLMAALELVK